MSFTNIFTPIWKPQKTIKVVLNHGYLCETLTLYSFLSFSLLSTWHVSLSIFVSLSCTVQWNIVQMYCFAKQASKAKCDKQSAMDHLKKNSVHPIAFYTILTDLGAYSDLIIKYKYFLINVFTSCFVRLCVHVWGMCCAGLNTSSIELGFVGCVVVWCKRIVSTV